MNAVERRHLALGEELGHLLVREDHQVLDQPVRLRLLVVVNGDDVAALVELERRLTRLDLER